MVGVFDPKNNSGDERKFPSSAATFAVLFSVLGIGAIFATQSAKFVSSDSRELSSASASQAALIPVVPPVATLTSFQDLDIAATETRLVSADEIRPKDTLTAVMDRMGVPRDDANAALYAVYDAGLIDPRKLRVGLGITAYGETSTTDANGQPFKGLRGLSIRHKRDASILVSRDANGQYHARELQTKLIDQTKRVTGTVESTLYQAALDNGAGDKQVYDFAEIFGYDVDFQRELQPGDRFEIVYDEKVDERGQFVESGEIVYAAFDGRALSKGYYRFTPSDDGATDYFDSTGKSARKFLMKTPINGARLSSSFGFRKHPISGFNKLHKGTDFAARTGTPIMAAGNGVIVKASRFGGYGNYVKIQHSNGFETAYAHLSKYGPGIKNGKRVRQGDIIGYVGTTGRSTGPHLHYEVIKNGQAINAMSLKLPTGRQLEGEHLKAFQAQMEAIDRQRGATSEPVALASAPLLTNPES